ncbi:MAG: glycosyltransferase family 2 protein, partial [Hungatella sp.]
MKISCIVLNYNDARNTMAQILRIRAYRCLDSVIVVDNASTDDSIQQLEPYIGEKVILLALEHNAGYGAGNNAGLHYAYEALQATHAVIANPDTDFTEPCVQELAQLFEGHQDLGVAAASMVDGSGGSQASGWPLRSWLKDLLDTGPVCRRIFRAALRYPTDYGKGKRAVYVDVVHGSMLMVDLEKMMICGAYDERVFLYGEENILGFRMKYAGFRTVQLLGQTYLHENSGTISKTYETYSRRQKLRYESARFYYRNYLHIDPFQMAVTRLFHQVVLFEIWFCKNVLRMS